MIKKLFSKKSINSEKEKQDSSIPDFLPVNAFQTALQYHQMGNFPQAEALYRQIIQHEPHNSDALHYLGVLCYQKGQHEAAIELINKAISLCPMASPMYCNLGLALQAQGKLNEAIENFQYYLTLMPNDAGGYYKLGIAFYQQNNLEAAAEQFQQALLFKPDNAELYCNLAVVLKDQGKLDLAIEKWQQAVSLNPSDVATYNNLATVFQEQGEFNQAIENYRYILGITPDNANVHADLGVAFWKLGNLEAAIAGYQKALELNPTIALVYANLGIALKSQGKLNKAIESYQQALLLNPDYVDVYRNLGLIFQEQNKHKEALESFKKALSLNPIDSAALGALFFTQLQCCDWTSYADTCEKIITGINAREQGYTPFSFLAISSSVTEQRQCAKNFANHYYPLQKKQLWTHECYNHGKIRIAYISGDFCEHPMAYLMAGLFEQHNRERFEIIAISLQLGQNGVTGQRVKAAFNQFIDVSSKSDYEISVLIREMEIDIAVDLMGFTRNCKTGIFAYRPAPVQVNYLGFPGTMGTDYTDYIIADKYVISLAQQIYYTEKIVYLPDCFQANDDKNPISFHTPTRTEAGLPEAGFVFCSFNNSYKLNPVFFDVWMRLLKAIPESVLWLIADNPMVSDNLRSEAGKWGIDPERLIFAGRVHYPDHLARLQLADLFLDSLPFNAGTTASDALWAGVPVITCSGEAFASRMAGSLLHAIGSPELITHNLQDYEALALKLATTPALLAEIRNKLAKNRDTYPLFNTDRFRRHIESAYISMWERYQRGEFPKSFNVPQLF